MGLIELETKVELVADERLIVQLPFHAHMPPLIDRQIQRQPFLHRLESGPTGDSVANHDQLVKERGQLFCPEGRR
jgi:hypothetical protein